MRTGKNTTIKEQNVTTYNIILTAALLGYHLTSREANEILHLFTGENLADAIRDYCAAYES